MSERHHSPARLSPAARLLVLAAAALFPCLAPPPPAPAQQAADAGPDGRALQRLEEQYGADAARSLQRLARDYRERGVPVGPLWEKALEGSSKGLPEDALVAGVRRWAEHLSRVGRILPESAGETALVAAADALRRSVPSMAIREIALGGDDGPPPDGIALPLVVLGDLVAAGVPVDEARSVVRTATERGQGPRAPLATSRAVRDLIEAGQLPEAAARRVRRAVERGEAPGSVPDVGPAPTDLLPPAGAPLPPGAGPPVHPAPPAGDGG